MSALFVVFFLSLRLQSCKELLVNEAKPHLEWMSFCLDQGKTAATVIMKKDSVLGDTGFVCHGQVRTPTAIAAGRGCWRS